MQNKTRVRPTNSASSLTAGAVSEEQFRQAFEAVLDLRVTSLKDLIAECQKQAVILENTNNDWTKRIKANIHHSKILTLIVQHISHKAKEIRRMNNSELWGHGDASSLTAGAVSEEQFRQAFEAVLDLRVTSLKDLIAECQKQAVILENTNNDWTKRIKALQSLRGLIKHDIGCYAPFAEQAYGLLGTALEVSVKDLRSQVCRETCMTIAFFCEKLGTSFWRVAEAIIPITLNLTQNSAKVMASSGRNCNIFITKNIHHSKILTLIVQHISHKAKEIRRMSIELICIIINQWDPTLVEKHSGELTHSIKLALSDADSEARVIARQAFEGLQSNYPTKAEILFQELEPAKQRMLIERSSTASSTHSINSERDNLPNPNRGLYNAQNSGLFFNLKNNFKFNILAFLNKRS
uniref:TOG domain-containing protein n=1 Tax=Meloidogyne incognita TaxID=6306 RepID=A0A914L5M7_MELIC